MDLVFGKVTGTTIGGERGAILHDVRGAHDGGDDDAAYEASAGEAAYGTLGTFGRPLDPTDEGYAEAIAVRIGDNLPVASTRDLRVDAARGNVNKGAVGHSDYTGARMALEPATDGTGSISTIYLPYQHDGDGVAAKAHAVIVDTATGNESISLVHADGHAVLLTSEGKVLLKNKAGDAFISVEDGKVVFSGSVQPSTNLVVGSPAVAFPVYVDPDPASVGLWITQVALAITQIAAYINGIAPGSVTVPTALPPVISTIAKASVA